jgi:hypothetical protein
LKAYEKTEPSDDLNITDKYTKPIFDFHPYNKKKSAFKILENYIAFKETVEDEDRIFYYTRI